ncbi:hypothetical protein G6F34_011104 [Rhizopus arrhizus]|nr:hypothetical protein G6F34_011104 [Rhizopus arrhizus]
MSSLRKGRFDSRSRTKGTAGSKARQAGSKGSKLISAIFRLPSLVVATAIRNGNCFAIKAISCTGDSDLSVMSRRTLPGERPALRTLDDVRFLATTWDQGIFFNLVVGSGACGRCVTALTDWLDILSERT